MDAAASMDERSDGVGVVSRAGTALPLLTSVKTRIHAKLHSVDADLTILSGVRKTNAQHKDRMVPARCESRESIVEHSGRVLDAPSVQRTCVQRPQWFVVAPNRG